MGDIARVPLPGSERTAVAGAENLGPVQADEQIELTIVLRRRAELPAGLVTGPDRITTEQLRDEYGAHPADLERVRSVLAANGMVVSGDDPASRRVFVTGSAATVANVFGTELTRVRQPDGYEHRHRSGAVQIPAELTDVVVAVLGLDTRRQARAFSRVHSGSGGSSYSVPQLEKVYAFPENTDGSGQTVAIVELGGGYADSDLSTYFQGIQRTEPSVQAVQVDGATNSPGTDPNTDVEVALDVEIVGALATGASILVYFAPNTDKGFLDAVSQAAHADPAPAAISISWGQSEDQWTEQARTALDQAMADAAALGTTVCAAAGDAGSSDNAADAQAHVDFPASSPNALACGGTSLTADSSGAVSAEVAWNDGSSGGATGGGVSDTFPVPQWQQNAGIPQRSGGGTGRGVPDVAADADPATGYQIVVGGSQTVVGGTSAVAPLWAGLIARLAQVLDRPLGQITTELYAGVTAGTAAPGFRDITSGDNGAYQAGAGWDACTGLGVPDGTALVQRLQNGGSA